VAFLDFIRNRNASKQQPVANKSQEQRPESAKQMYSRQAAQEKANQPPISGIPPNDQARVESIKATLEKATQHVDNSAVAPSATPADDMGSREAMQQNMAGQDKVAPQLSPTSMQKGKKGPEKQTANAQEKTERSQSLPRPQPSWER